MNEFTERTELGRYYYYYFWEKDYVPNMDALVAVCMGLDLLCSLGITDEADLLGIFTSEDRKEGAFLHYQNVKRRFF